MSKLIKVKQLDEDAKLPSKKHIGDACFDLHSLKGLQLYPGRPTLVRTGLAMEIPDGYELLIRPRSGLSTKGILVINSPGTIDSNYRGEVNVLLLATIDGYKILPGERIAQCTLKKVEACEFVYVDEALSTTDRGGNGFGSSGRV